MYWFPHIVNNLTLYDLVSGWIPCGAILTGVVGIFRHWQCEKEGCHKLGHRHPDHGRPVCRTHYHHNVKPTRLMTSHEPTIYLHPDGEHISIRFADQTTGDTLLKVGGQRGPAGWRDKEIAAEWVAAVEARLTNVR